MAGGGFSVGGAGCLVVGWWGLVILSAPAGWGLPASLITAVLTRPGPPKHKLGIHQRPPDLQLQT